MDSGIVSDHSVEATTCALCQRVLSSEYEAYGDFAANMCGDCKFLYLEDLGTPPRDAYRRRPSRRRRARYSSSESLEDIFSQQFSHIINLVQHNQSPGSGLEDLPVDGGESAARMSQRTTPSGSRRWRRVFSDTESDGFDYTDSLYGASESNVSFGRFRVSHGENDVVSFSGYGGDSDASVDMQGFLDTEPLVLPDDVFDSDTDIDPMHAGLNPWNSNDPEDDDGDDDEDDEDDEEDDEWEEVESAENMVESSQVSQSRNSLIANSGRRNHPVNQNQRTYIAESEGPLHWRMRERNSRDILSNFEDSEGLAYVTNSGDYLDAVGFEELLEHLAEADSLRRGAPPASVSFVNNLLRIVITKEHQRHDDSNCAICKDVMTIGTEVNQLPCLHLYHPSCIFPWLSARNSCPLCRYELPTDDRDYEEGKRNAAGRADIRNVRRQNVREDRSSAVSGRVEGDENHARSETRMEHRFQPGSEVDANRSTGENGRGSWFFLAAAPIVGLVGIVLVLWLGRPLIDRSGLAGHGNFADQARRHSHVAGVPAPHRETRSRRWWSLFGSDS